MYFLCYMLWAFSYINKKFPNVLLHIPAWYRRDFLQKIHGLGAESIHRSSDPDGSTLGQIHHSRILPAINISFISTNVIYGIL